jgi:predicted alternative tryptophan synthase beta-subunit
MGVVIGVKSIHVTLDYVKKFTAANHVFLHQSVFDVKSKQQLSLFDIPQDLVIENQENFTLYP